MFSLKGIFRPKQILAGSPSDVVPIIKVSEPEGTGSLLTLPPNDTPITERFVGDLLVMYGFDLPHFFSFVIPHDCARFGLSVSDLRSLALTNLRRRLPPMQRRGDFPAFMLAVDGNYEASLLLLEEIWEAQKEFVPGELVAAVPSRDVLVFTGSQSPEGLAAIRGSIARTFQAGDHVLTRTLLVWRDKQWSVFAPQ